MRPTLKTPPAADVVDLETFKAHLRLDGIAEDGLARTYLDAAVSRLDGWNGVLGRCLINQVWSFDLDGWYREQRLPFPDVSAVVVKYLDGEEAEQTLAASEYDVIEDAQGCVLVMRDGFAAHDLAPLHPRPVTIEVTAGFGETGDDVPAALRSAVMLLGGHLYHNRENVVTGTTATEMPFGVSVLIAPWRMVGI